MINRLTRKLTSKSSKIPRIAQFGDDGPEGIGREGFAAFDGSVVSAGRAFVRRPETDGG